MKLRFIGATALPIVLLSGLAGCSSNSGGVVKAEGTPNPNTSIATPNTSPASGGGAGAAQGGGKSQAAPAKAE